MAGERLLVVEDEFLIRATLVELLEDEGYEVIAADNGEDALEILRSDGGVAVLMTDMSLAGGMSGTTLAAAARGLRSELPVIFMTGRLDLVVPEGTGPQALLSKPYTASDVTNALHKVLTAATH